MSSEQNNYRAEEQAHSMTDSVNRSISDKINISCKNSNKSENSGPQSIQSDSTKNLLQLNSSMNSSSQNSASNSTNNLLHHQSQQNLSTITAANDHSAAFLSAATVNSPHNPCISALDLPPSRETYKSRKKIYQQEKKKLAEQLLTTLNDPTVIVLADWLKVRATFKSWTKVYCELRPGLLVIYKSSKTHKSKNWIGTVLLNICSVIERPSKKGGFCFKLFSQVNDQNIWAKNGPKGETFGALTLPLPLSYLMFRASSQVTGNRWIKAINLSFQSSKQIIRNDLHSIKDLKLNTEIFNRLLDDEDINVMKDEHEIEREHFVDQDLTDDQNSSAEHEYNRSTDSDTTGSIENDFTSRHLAAKHSKHQSDEKLDKQGTVKRQPQQRISNDATLSSQLSSRESSQLDTKSRTTRYLITLKKSPSDTSVSDPLIVDQTEYVFQPEEVRFGEEQSQGEDVAEENKSLLWSLLKQVRPGDLSKVVLPTFILEPRSFLEKLTDYYYHCYILASATNQNDPFERMKEVVKWYVSGLYKKPNGLKKPYNPILGEKFRCYWEHPSLIVDQAGDQMTKTFYVAEQISHHPPVSAFHCVNRHQGYLVSGVVQVSSNYYGNSVSAILNGNVRLSLINRGEDYLMNMPYAHCKGILFGGLTFELGGKVQITCERTNYSCDLEFKLKPFLGGEMNLVYGKIKLGNETLETIEGHWDKQINIKEKRTGKQTVLWAANQETFRNRLKRYVVPLDKQEEFESANLWKKVSEAILAGDQKAATVEKTKLEDRQRKEAKYRLENNVPHTPKLFELDPLTNEWHYRYEDVRPWDPRTDIAQFEKSFIIQTLTKHRTISKTGLTNPNCSIVETSPMLNRPRTYPSNLTPQKSSHIARKRSPKSRSKHSSDSHPLDQEMMMRKSETNNSSLFDKFDSIDGDEEEDTDYSAQLKNTNTSHLTSKLLLKRIEKNESELMNGLTSLKNRQQKIEKIILEERQKQSNRLPFYRTLFSNSTNSPFSLSNIITIFILTVIIQLIIYKFNNNYIRK